MKDYSMLLVALSVLMILGGTVACDAGSGDTNQSGDDDDNDDNDNDDNDNDDDNDDNNEDDDDNGGFDPNSECDCGDLNICGQVVDLETWSSSPNPSTGFAIIESMGTNDCIVTQHGCKMVAISTGPVGQANPNEADANAFGDGTAQVADDPLPPYQGEAPTTSTPYRSCDNLQLRFRLKAPEGAEGFSFDFLYASAEYAEWVNMGFNDAFYAIVQIPELNDGQPTNISFDDNNNEIEVDVNFFENASHPCDETGSGWEPAVSLVSGSTGWLRTQWPVGEGEEFNITFSIHDEGDCIYDSIVFLDNFQWLGDVVDPGTGPI
jgi:hypothetical protein